MLKEIWTEKHNLEFTPNLTVIIPVYFIPHITVFLDTCILVSHSVAQQWAELSVLRNTRFNNVQQSDFHTAAVSLVGFSGISVVIAE